ncbi:DnaJ family domain-containing protein [Paenibacillus sp.]|uniref:DnaJ family domain-containing protein n=1 Tax=Paenibacillus sp. TaxID=58172 RepID=UPI002D652E9D|nr:DnaJ family domain-containing protein [Paenibacillus sp.]HZG56092.1 DnaJ family domain-containing protein [Paenibacillus sp.]
MGDRASWERLKAKLQLEESMAGFHREVNDRVDEAVREFEKNGGMERVKGKGKPLQLETGDPIYGVLRTANVRPHWLELQHDIRDALKRLHEETMRGESARAEEALAAINAKIVRYNAIVPHYTMQKSKVEWATLSKQREAWE